MSEKKSEWELLNVATQNKWNILDILLNSIDVFRLDINAKNEEGNALIHILAAKNPILLEKTIEKGGNVNLVNRNGKTALHLAVEEGNQRAVRSLVKYRADQNIKDTLGETPIFKAIRNDHYEIVRLLINTGSFISVTNKEGCNLLHLAVENTNRIKIVKLLLTSQHQVKVNHLNNLGFSPLHIAVTKGHVDTAKLLIENRANIDCNLLHVAVQLKQTEIAKVLLKLGINVDSRNINGETPLHLAVENESVEIFRILLEQGACVNLTDDDGYAPIHVASKAKIPDFVNILLTKGALINLQTLNGDSPLHRSSSLGNLITTKCLLNQDADINLSNNDGCTPIHLAGYNGHRLMVDYLVDRGADINLLDNFNRPPSFNRQVGVRTNPNKSNRTGSLGVKTNLPTRIPKAGNKSEIR